MICADSWRAVRHQPKAKLRLVSIFETLKAGSYQPDGGWFDQRRAENCEAVMEAGFAERIFALACVAVDLLADRQPDTGARHHVRGRVGRMVAGHGATRVTGKFMYLYTLRGVPGHSVLLGS